MSLPRWHFAEPQRLESPYASALLLRAANDSVSNPIAAVANVPVLALARATVGFAAAAGDAPAQPSPLRKCWTVVDQQKGPSNQRLHHC